MTTSPRTVLFVTGNANKLKEVRSILLAATQDPSKGDAAAMPSFSVESEDLDVPEVQGTTQEVAMAKVRAAAEIVGGPCITEDTSLGFEALGGLPGPYIKYFMNSVGHEGAKSIPFSRSPTGSPPLDPLTRLLARRPEQHARRLPVQARNSSLHLCLLGRPGDGAHAL